MERVWDFFYHHKVHVLIFFILVVGGIGSVIAFSYDNFLEEDISISDSGVTLKEEVVEEIEEGPVLEEKKEEVNFRVDVKGMVLNPNVYEVSPNTRIYDVILMAGGVIDGATTENINLSKKVSDEMVIYVFSNEEYQLKRKVSKNEYSYEITEEIEKGTSIIENFVDDEKIVTKVSLNQGTLEDFMSINGLGQAKAQSILNYRNEHGSFASVLEVKEVDGIGEVLYEKIKDFLTL